MAFGMLRPTIRQACSTWDDQATQLRGGTRRLGDALAAVEALGPRAAAAGRAYLAVWCAEVSRLATETQARSDGLARFAFSVVGFDDAAADDLRAALPWDGRFAVFAIPPSASTGP